MLRTVLSLAVPIAALAVLAPPASAQWVLANYTDLLGVDDAEFTPDGKWLVIRDNTSEMTVQVYEAATGARVLHHQTVGGFWNGVCQDAVGVGNERAIVIGSKAVVVDLTTMSILAEHLVGAFPRDVAVTPDGTLAAVRGGDKLYVIDLIGGAIVAKGFGRPAIYSGGSGYDVDSVVADDDHAVFVSEKVAGSTLLTSVTVFDLHPTGGGPPAIVFATDGTSHQDGKPNDIAMTPDGRYAAVRSDMEVGLYRLDGAQSQQVWRQRLKGDPGPFGASVMDSIEVTDQRIATISRRSNAGVGAQLDVFDLAGTHKYAYLDGDPHDLALTPDGDTVATRTHLRVTLFDVRKLPSQEFLLPLDEVNFTGTHTSWDSGLDSIVATDRHVAAMSRNASETKVRVWDISQRSLEKVFGTVHQDKALDVDVAPDGSRVIFGFLKSFLVVDLRTAEVVLEADGTFMNGAAPWCDGVAIDGPHAAAFGVGQINGQGWISILDLFEEPVRYCPTNPNSTGAAGELVVSGSPSVAANDLALWAVNLPPDAYGRFLYGDQMTQVPFGDGFACVGGLVARFPVVQVSEAGVVTYAVDNTNLPPNGGAILPGTTWNFQLVYRDGKGPTTTFNLTDALSITFGS